MNSRQRRRMPFSGDPQVICKLTSGGESIAGVAMRIEHTFNTLRRECSREKVIIVCHGEVMWAFRARVERLTPGNFIEMHHSDNPHDQVSALTHCQIQNGNVLHYTRVDPESGEIHPEFRWYRMSCPWKPELASNKCTATLLPQGSSSTDLCTVMRFVGPSPPRNFWNRLPLFPS